MKDKIGPISFLLVFMAFISSCEKPADREFPRVRTLPATNINSDGVELNAETLNPENFNITECGFIVFRGEPSTTNYIGEVTADLNKKTGRFSKKITAGLTENLEYYYLAYTVSDSIITTGDDVSFLNKCDNASEPLGFYPVTGHVLDSVLIEFNGFVGNAFLYEVRFNDLNAEILGVMNHEMLVIVPPALTDKESTVSVQISDSTTSLNDKFTLLSPEIGSFSPTTVTAGNIVTITGNNFHRLAEYNIVRFNNTVADILSCSPTEIQVIAPSLDNVTCTISVTVSGQEAVANSTIMLQILTPVIESFAPAEVYPYDTVTIYGANFNYSPNENIVKFGETEARIISSSPTELKVIVPAIEIQECLINVTVSGKTATSSEAIRVMERPVVWTQVADFPGGEAYKVSTFAINGYGYAGLGTRLHHDYIDKFWKYDPAADSWTEIAPFPGETRVLAYGFTLDNEGYIGAGFDMDSPNREILNGYYSYNPGTNLWYHITDYPGTTDINILGSCNVVENEVYVSQYGFYKLSVEPTEWTKISSNSEHNIYSFTNSFVIDDIIYYVCGLDVSTTPYENKSTVWSFNTNTGIWEEKNPFPGGSRYTGVGFSLNGKGYFGLGHNLDNHYYKDIWQYDPDADSWTLYDYLPGIARSCAFVFTIDNFAYIGTGANSSGTLLKDVYRFNPLN